MSAPESFDNLERHKQAFVCVMAGSPNCETCESGLRDHLEGMAQTMPVDLLLDVHKVIYEHRRRQLKAEGEAN